MKRTDLQSRLQDGSILLGDGAMGTMLQQMGLQAGECPELWNIRHPDRVRKVTNAYLQAGAETLITNSFGASSVKLRVFGLEAQAREINRAAAEIAREIAEDRALVAGSIGPTGEFLEPLGTLSRQEAYEAFAEQARALEEGGADFIQIETFSDLEEAKIAFRAVRENTALPVLVSLTFEKGPKGYFTIMGNRPADLVRAFENEEVAALGTNCGNGIDEITEIIRQLRDLTRLPLFAGPNAGKPRLSQKEVVYSQDPGYFASRLPALIEAGARYVKGCCGSTPEHIRHMKEVLIRLKTTSSR
jgi:5-methyltetrahydrofolate--homocysteine methyltransferase